MAWTWRWETAEGVATTQDEVPDESFPSRGDAESWLGEEWSRLREAGVSQVTLLDGEDTVYTMSLEDVD